MQIRLKEKIGNPDLFTGRKNELAYFLNWIDRIKREISMSTAILSRRKTGKTALLQRLYNIIFNENDRVIPFYFEIRETDQWIIEFGTEFLLTFICQYLAFKTRKYEYLSYSKNDFARVSEAVKAEKLGYLADLIRDARVAIKDDHPGSLWNIARKAPRMAAQYYDDRIVQIIDEFQFINRFIFRDKACKNRIGNLAGSYLGTAEYKNAPLLVAGRWVGWLSQDLHRMLPGRFQFHYLENIPEYEAFEMILKYSHLEDISVSEETVPLIAGLAEGNPFYISSLFRSKYPKKDLTTEKGLLETLEFETLHKEGGIRGIWTEYMGYAIKESNDVHAKRIVLYLSKHRQREVSRDELKDKLGIEMTDSQLEEKLKILVGADIIEQGRGNFYYRGVPDNIFDKVFRGIYADEIELSDPGVIKNEYRSLVRELRKKSERIQGEYSHYKGKFAEYLIIDNLRYRAYRNQEFFRNMMNNLPDDFEFSEYKTVWSYSASPVHQREIQIDIFARTGENDYSLIGEVKNRKAKFSVKEAGKFVKKAEELMKLENVGKAVLFVFSVNGFFKNTLDYMEKHGIAWASDPRWLESGRQGGV
ncbi:hypothetical protein QUF80_07240 [Desulfococcaceae bacterium HSG8]|nr:hypothetical protein [Desulfococcaceae bacterium HSG8]